MDTITGLALNPNGTHLLSTAMDSALCSWDIRPFVVNENQRCERMFAGARHGAEKMLLRCSWSPDGDQVACGSADRYTHMRHQ
jgi:Prp8 binding protein